MNMTLEIPDDVAQRLSAAGGDLRGPKPVAYAPTAQSSSGVLERVSVLLAGTALIDCGVVARSLRSVQLSCGRSAWGVSGLITNAPG
jgi:hypothetical protein